MKQIKIIVQSDKRHAVIDAIENVGVGGITVLPANGRGKGQRSIVSEGRGTGRHVAPFNSLDAIISAITNAASNGSKGDGKIFISTIDETVDIGSKEKGPKAL